MEKLSDLELQNQTILFRQRLDDGETLDDLLPEAFATIREANKRVLGMFAYDVQILGGIALHQGNIAEMKTGEGKTLTATFPLYLNGLSSKGAILVTTNDYLAKRDAEEMGQVFKWLGLTVGVGVFEDDEDVDTETRKAVYDADVTYTTSTALGFDYLTDNLVASKNEKFMRDFNYVIVDEADEVLLDSAQTPLIISGSPRVQSNLYDISDQFVQTLSEEEYYYDEEDKVVYLTSKGSRYADEYFDIDDLYSNKNFELNRHINLALRAHNLYKKNKDYVVEDDEVKLLDIRTGRILEGTRLQSGIHQAIETKEKVKKTKESRAMGSVTYQSLFNMFPKIAGMSGTAKIAEDELISTYKLPVIVIPTNTPVQRIDFPDKVYTTLPEKLQATIDTVKEIHKTGQPILLVSGTVDISEIYSKLLLQEGIAHSVLTAKNVAKEALIIKEAGQLGAVTVATPLAGRGTDIKLGKGVKELGGLAVIGTERMPNSRVDWQLRGRAGRQGDPGMSLFFVSLEDEILINHGPKWVRRYFKNHKDKSQGKLLTQKRFRRAVAQAQEKSEDAAVSARNFTIQYDESLRVQRKKIYALRDSLIFDEESVKDEIDAIFKEMIKYYIAHHPKRTLQSLRRYILDNYSYKFQYYSQDFDIRSDHSVYRLLWHLYRNETIRKEEIIDNPEKISEFYRVSILKAIDECWIEQVDHLQQLKSVVSTRQIAQRNGMFEYYEESLLSYDRLGEEVKKKIIRNVMLSSVDKTPDGKHSIYFV
ncbi:preprotein translocase subunit SecA [Streptococcus porcorum]|uniref:Protein translocase subunit SecA n=2 Tax=Streptococcus porcorum TaxID=701526 RepID=A0ABV2JE09_9STRE